MKKIFLLLAIAISLSSTQKTFAIANIDSVVTWAYYQGWYEASRSYYHYTGNTLDSIISWSYYQGWYESGKTYFYYSGPNIDSTISYTFYQGWYHSGRGYYYYTGSTLDSVHDYTYNQGWYFSNRTYYTYTGSCIDSLTGFTYYQGWYESTHSRYYSQPNCEIDSVYTSSYYQGWYDAARSYYYYGNSTHVLQQQVGEAGVVLTPNPATDKITIESEGDYLSLAENIQLFNSIGKRMDVNCQTQGNSKSAVLDIGALMPGIYLIKIKTMQGSLSQKFIKQ